MSAQNAYSFTVLRYVHDTLTGEFFNVGVALYAPEAKYLSAICRTTYQRLSTAFPGLNGEHFRAVMRHVQAKFEQAGERLGSSADPVSSGSVMDVARAILPTDDGSFQWAPMGVGITHDPQRKIEAL